MQFQAMLPNFFNESVNLFDVTPKVPIETGKSTTCNKLLILFTSSIRSLQFLSIDTPMSMVHQFLWILYSTSMPGLVCWMKLSICMLKFHSILTMSLSTIVSGLWLHHLTSLINPTFWHSSNCIIVAKSTGCCLYPI